MPIIWTYLELVSTVRGHQGGPEFEMTKDIQGEIPCDRRIKKQVRYD